MAQQTPLYEEHLACGAKMVDFHGWMIPLHYGSQLDEHHQVRRDVAKLTVPGKALYTDILNASGGVIDDLIVYFLSETEFRLEVNYGIRDKDVEWIIRPAERYQVVAGGDRNETIFRRTGRQSVHRYHRLYWRGGL